MKKGGIYLVEFPSNKSHEQSGLRPAIIFSDDVAEIISIIPFTTKINSTKYNYTLKVSKSEFNKLNEDSIALIFQLRAIDKKRIKNKLGELEEDLLNKINKLLIEMLKLK